MLSIRLFSKLNTQSPKCNEDRKRFLVATDKAKELHFETSFFGYYFEFTRAEYCHVIAKQFQFAENCPCNQPLSYVAGEIVELLHYALITSSTCNNVI